MVHGSKIHWTHTVEKKTPLNKIIKSNAQYLKCKENAQLYISSSLYT